MRQKGSTLVEIILVVAVVFFIALLIANLPASIASVTKSRHISIAKDIAGKQIEYLRKRQYQNLSNGVVPFSSADLSLLSASSATYEINDCPLEICTLAEHAKEAKVTVIWDESGENRKVELVTIISEGGIGQ